MTTNQALLQSAKHRTPRCRDLRRATPTATHRYCARQRRSQQRAHQRHTNLKSCASSWDSTILRYGTQSRQAGYRGYVTQSQSAVWAWFSVRPTGQ